MVWVVLERNIDERVRERERDGGMFGDAGRKGAG